MKSKRTIKKGAKEEIPSRPSGPNDGAPGRVAGWVSVDRRAKRVARDVTTQRLDAGCAQAYCSIWVKGQKPVLDDAPI